MTVIKTDITLIPMW